MSSEGLLYSVGLSVCPHVYSRTVAAVEGYVGMCNGRSAQQESGTSYIVKEQRVYGGRLKFTLMCTFLVKAESGGYQTWICG